MGFGSYDESEQQQQTVSEDEEEDVEMNTRENEYEGEMTVENGGSADDLLGQLQEIKENRDAEEE